jgi:hypothetical protein
MGGERVKVDDTYTKAFKDNAARLKRRFQFNVVGLGTLRVLVTFPSRMATLQNSFTITSIRPDMPRGRREPSKVESPSAQSV